MAVAMKSNRKSHSWKGILESCWLKYIISRGSRPCDIGTCLLCSNGDLHQVMHVFSFSSMFSIEHMWYCQLHWGQCIVSGWAEAFNVYLTRCAWTKKDDRHTVGGEGQQWAMADWFYISHPCKWAYTHTIHTTAPETHLQMNRSLMDTPTLVMLIVTSKHKQW